MSRTVAIQADPLAALNPQGDSTLELAREARARGHALFWYEPHALTFEDGQVRARAFRYTVADWPERGTLGEPTVLDLAEVDVVLMRQDPPFDLAYITATHLLEHLEGRTLVANDPFHVRNAPEKLLVQRFPQFHPPTLITLDLDAIRAFRAKHGEVIVKPLHGFGGHGVFHLRDDDPNLDALVELFAQSGKEPLIVQRFLPEVRDGDKRVILIDGEVAGTLLRMPEAGSVRSNLRVGGSGSLAELSAREREICATVGPELARRGLILAGLDLIGGWLTEINVTSPTGLTAIRRLSGENIAARFWDAVEKRLT